LLRIFQHEIPINQVCEEDFEDDKQELIARGEFSRNLFAIHSDGHFGLTIQVGGKEFKTSKYMLMGCFEVFHQMLTCPNSIEAKTGIVKIEDTKPEIIDALIRWIYQVDVENMEEVAQKLYQVADKYAIDPLKKKCVKTMAKSLSNENAPSRLFFSYKHGEEKLKQYVISFLREDHNNLVNLMASGEWLELCRDDPEEAKKMLADIRI